MSGEINDILEESFKNRLHRNSQLIETGSNCSLSSDDMGREGRTPRRPPYQFDELDKRWMRASLNCDFEVLKKCYCEDEALLNKKDHFTALIHWVAKKGRLDILRWLIQNKADLTVRTGQTAIHIATIHGNEHIINKLIHEFDADVNVRDYSGRTARQYLHTDSSVSVQRALNHVPSVFLTKPEAPLSPKPYNNRTLPASISMPAIFGESSTDHNNNTNHPEYTTGKKKRGLSLSNSFKRGKKSSVVKRDQGESPRYRTIVENDSPTDHAGNLQQPGNPHYGTQSHFHDTRHTQSSTSLTLSSPSVERRRVSENIVNGYAGFINQNKYHAKTHEESTVPKQQWSINTWV